MNDDKLAAQEVAQKIGECWSETSYTYKRVKKLQFVATNSKGTLFIATNQFGDKVAFKLVNDEVERMSLLKVLSFLDKKPSDNLL